MRTKSLTRLRDLKPCLLTARGGPFCVCISVWPSFSCAWRCGTRLRCFSCCWFRPKGFWIHEVVIIVKLYEQNGYDKSGSKAEVVGKCCRLAYKVSNDGRFCSLYSACLRSETLLRKDLVVSKSLGNRFF